MPQAIDTIGAGINDAGTVAGNYDDADYGMHGFVRSASGQITTFDVPECAGAHPTAINNKGQVMGTCADSKNRVVGFMRSANGNFKTFRVLGSGDSEAADMNDKGLITGRYEGPQQDS